MSKKSHLSNFKCGKCGKIYKRKLGLANHINDDMSCKIPATFKPTTKRFKCDKCEQKYIYNFELDMHIGTQHEGERIDCDMCDYQAKSKKSVRVHKNIVHEGIRYECDKCEEYFTRSDHLAGHKKTQHEGIVTWYKCDKCEYKAEARTSLKRHIRKHIDPYKCEHCSKPFTELNGLRKHVRLHTGENPFKCQQCNMEVRTSGLLKKHMISHTNERPHTCFKCTMTFKRKAGIKRHMIMNHSNIIKEKKNKPYQCKDCPASFLYKRSLKKHSRKQHGHIEENRKCSQCDKIWKSVAGLMIHIAKAHTPKNTATCDQCARTFDCEQGLKLHIWQAHNSNLKLVSTEVHTCDHCGQQFKSESVLKMHKTKQLIKKTKQAERLDAKKLKSERCLKCDEIFNYRGLKIHIARKHGSESWWKKKESIFPPIVQEDKSVSQEELGANTETCRACHKYFKKLMTHLTTSLECAGKYEDLEEMRLRRRRESKKMSQRKMVIEQRGIKKEALIQVWTQDEEDKG